KLCDRVAVMEQGSLVALGTPAELTRQYVKRMHVELEVDPCQIEAALSLLKSVRTLVIGAPKREKEMITLTVSGREAIPELLFLLLHNGLRVYRLAPQEVNLEEVYFALH